VRVTLREFQPGHLSWRKLSGASLCFSRFVRTTFGDVCFRYADLSYVRIYRGDLEGADFGHAELTRALFLIARSLMSTFPEQNCQVRYSPTLILVRQRPWPGPVRRSFHDCIDTLIRSEGGFRQVSFAEPACPTPSSNRLPVVALRSTRVSSATPARTNPSPNDCTPTFKVMASVAGLRRKI